MQNLDPSSQNDMTVKERLPCIFLGGDPMVRGGGKERMMGEGVKIMEVFICMKIAQ
jgi:hypothetical protein